MKDNEALKVTGAPGPAAFGLGSEGCRFAVKSSQIS